MHISSGLMLTLFGKVALAHEWGKFPARADVGAAEPPDCSVDCVTNLVLEYCGSPTNTVCVCNNTNLTAALGPCVVSACNITETLRFQKIAANTCGIVNDTSRLTAQLHVSCTVPVLTFVFFACRMFIRSKKGVGLGPDDWTMAVAMCFYLATTGTGLGISLHGFGQHTWYLTPEQVSTSLKYFYLSEPLYLLTITFTRLSLLLFFMRIFPQQGLRRAVWATIWFTCLSNFGVLIGLIAQCIPIHGAWTNWMYKVPPVKCINTSALVWIGSGLGILQDLMILTIPLPILGRLKLQWGKRASILAMFSLGWFAITCSLLRLPGLEKLWGSTDPSFDQAPIAWWTNLEMGVSIICGCLPAWRSLLSHLFPSLRLKLGPVITGSVPPLGITRSQGEASNDRQGVKPLTRDFVQLDEYPESPDEVVPECRMKNDASSTGSEEIQYGRAV